MIILPEDFYQQDSLIVARALLGKVIVRDGYQFKIVETEAYRGEVDKGAHVHKTKKTARTAPLYEVGGTVYVYLIYGMYHCLNIAAHKKDVPHCVLIRAVEPLDELAINYARENRKVACRKLSALTNGPGKLTQALQIDRTFNFHKVTEKSSFYIAQLESIVESFEVIEAKRINITYAEEYQDKPWRFYIKDNEFVSIKVRREDESRDYHVK